MRDNHLRKKEYLDAKNYPQIRFASTQVTASSQPGEYGIKGKLTIKNTTKEISFTFKYSTLTSFKKPVSKLTEGVSVWEGGCISMADNLTV